MKISTLSYPMLFHENINLLTSIPHVSHPIPISPSPRRVTSHGVAGVFSARGSSWIPRRRWGTRLSTQIKGGFGLSYVVKPIVKPLLKRGYSSVTGQVKTSHISRSRISCNLHQNVVLLGLFGIHGIQWHQNFPEADTYYYDQVQGKNTGPKKGTGVKLRCPGHIRRRWNIWSTEMYVINVIILYMICHMSLQNNHILHIIYDM